MTRFFTCLASVTLFSTAGIRAEGAGEFRIALPRDNAPYATTTSVGTDSGASGYDADVARAALGHETVLIPTDLTAAVELLDSGKVDAICGWPVSALTSGKEDLLVSSSYRQSTLGAWVRKEALLRHTGDLPHARIRAAAQSPAWNFARSRGWNPTSSPAWSEAFASLQKGEADAVIAPLEVGRALLADSGIEELRQLTGSLESLPVAFVTRNPEVLSLLDRKLETLNRTGNLARLESGWGMKETTTEGINHDQFLAFGYGAMIIMGGVLLVRRAHPRIRSRGLAGLDPRQAALPRAPIP